MIKWKLTSTNYILIYDSYFEAYCAIANIYYIRHSSDYYTYNASLAMLDMPQILEFSFNKKKIEEFAHIIFGFGEEIFNKKGFLIKEIELVDTDNSVVSSTLNDMNLKIRQNNLLSFK